MFLSVAVSQTPAYVARPQTSAPCGVSVYVSAFNGTKLHCLTTGAHPHEQLAQSCYWYTAAT